MSVLLPLSALLIREGKAPQSATPSRDIAKADSMSFHNGTEIFEANITEPNRTLKELCTYFTEAEENRVQNAAFWIDGVAKTTLAFLGIFSNFVAAHILNKKDMRNSFNLCLVCLSFIDTIFLIGSILESFRRRLCYFCCLRSATK